MKKTLFIIAAAVAVLSGCQQENLALVNNSKEMKPVRANIEATRTNLTPDGEVFHVNWIQGDRIRLISDAGNNIYYTEQGGTPSAEFWFTSGDTCNHVGALKAYYPAYLGNGYLASSQEYADGGSTANPMYAECTVETDSEVPALNFKNLCGILKLNVTSTVADAKIKYITVTANQGMSGRFTVVDNAATVEGTDGVTLFCGDAGVALPASFSLSVPANTYTNLAITAITTDGKTQTIKLKEGASIKVDRSMISEGTVAFDKLAATELGGTAILPAGPDFNAAIKQLALEDETLTYAALDEEIVTKIIFNTNCPLTSGTAIQDMNSEKPVYLSVDKASGIVTVSTPASEFKLQSDGSYMFAYFGSLEEIVNLKAINTADCEDMHNMFCYVNMTNRKLKYIDLSNFNTEKCTTMRSMFNGCRTITELDLSKFNTSLVEDMSYMFQYCVNLKKIDCTSFNTENVADMHYMFYDCYRATAIDVSSFNTENVANFDYFMGDCQALESAILTNFNTENATDLGRFFYHCYSLREVDCTSFDTSSATEIRSFFNRCDALEVIDVSWVKIPQITNTTYSGYFFYDCKSLRELYLGEDFDFGVSKPTYMPCANDTPFENRPGSVHGSITVYCTQDLADWFSKTGWRWVHNGLIAPAGSYTTPIPITFKHFQTGQELSTEWSTTL